MPTNLSFFRMRMHKRKKKLKFNCLLAKNSCLYLKRFLSWSKLQKCENVPSTFFSRGWLLQWSTMDFHWIQKIWVEIAMSMDSCLVLLRYVHFKCQLYLAHVIETTKFTNSESPIFCLLAWSTVGRDTLQFINWNHATFSNSF